MTPAISVRHLSKTYPSVKALDDVSFEVQKGEIFGLLGANGAGKTTAIHILLGAVIPAAGEVTMLGLPLKENRPALYRRINFSSAYVQMPFNLPVEQNLDIYARLYGVKNRREKIMTLLEKFQLVGRMKSKTGSLSSGEQTRLNLCKALVNDPEILFLDEPTASLDPDIAELVRRTLKGFQKETGLTIIYTSHNMAEVEELCDRILFIHRGKKIIEGTQEEVRRRFQEESLEKIFISVARSGDVKDMGE